MSEHVRHEDIAPRRRRQRTTRNRRRTSRHLTNPQQDVNPIWKEVAP